MSISQSPTIDSLLSGDGGLINNSTSSFPWLWNFIYLVLILSVIYHIYGYYQHWKEVQRVKHIPGYSFYSYFTLRFLSPDQDFLFSPRLQARNAAKFGKENIWRITIGTNTVCFAVHPDNYKEILVTKAKYFRKHPLFNNMNVPYHVKNLFTDYGDGWKRHRQLTKPSFSDETLSLVLRDHISHISKRLVEKMWERRDKNDQVNINNWINRTAIDVIGRAGFGMTDLDAIGNEHERMPLITKTIFEVLSAGLLFKRKHIEAFTKIFFPQKYKMVFKEWPSILFNLVEKRENEIKLESESGEVFKSNLISQMLLSKREDDSQADDSSKFSFTKDEIVANSHAFLLAGEDTSQNTQIWMFYFLAKDKERQERLRKELREQVGESGIDFALYMDMEKLNYARNVISETLRLKGPAPTNSRFTMQKVEIAGKMIPKGVTVEMKFCVSQTDPDYWGSDSMEFIPERFDKPEVIDMLKNNKFIFCPFSAGKRQCIGKRFAEIEMLSVLHQVISNFELECVTKGEIGEVADVTMKPSRDIYLKLKKLH